MKILTMEHRGYRLFFCLPTPLAQAKEAAEEGLVIVLKLLTVLWLL